MAANYDRQNDQLKGIQHQRTKIEKLVSGLDFNDNCIITGGQDVTFTNGAKVANRKIVLEKVIERLIIENKQSVIIFYKSPYLIRQIMDWYQTRGIRRECNVVSRPAVFNGMQRDYRCLAPFLDMADEEIIYTVRSMAAFINITFDQYSETFLEYLLNIIGQAGYEKEFEHLLLLASKSDEELTRLAIAEGLMMESRFFAKTNNGSETVRRVLKEMNNYFRSYYQPDEKRKLNICSEVRKNNVLFIEIDDQYQPEILEYFCNELKCCSKKCPYIVFDDILLKNNPNFENFLLQSTSLRFCIGAMDISIVLCKENLDDFISQTQTKFLLHYDNVNAAEKITVSVGYYYHIKVSEEESTNRETFQFVNNSTSKGITITDEKRLIIEGSDLLNLTASQLYLIDSNSGRIFVEGIL